MPRQSLILMSLVLAALLLASASGCLTPAGTWHWPGSEAATEEIDAPEAAASAPATDSLFRRLPMTHESEFGGLSSDAQEIERRLGRGW